MRKEPARVHLHALAAFAFRTVVRTDLANSRHGQQRKRATAFVEETLRAFSFGLTAAQALSAGHGASISLSIAASAAVASRSTFTASTTISCASDAVMHFATV